MGTQICFAHEVRVSLCRVRSMRCELQSVYVYCTDMFCLKAEAFRGVLRCFGDGCWGRSWVRSAAGMYGGVQGASLIRLGCTSVIFLVVLSGCVGSCVGRVAVDACRTAWSLVVETVDVTGGRATIMIHVFDDSSTMNVDHNRILIIR